MRIDELDELECLDLLTRVQRGNLACAKENQPYVVPFFFAYQKGYIHSFSTVGQKIDWMRVNPLVCVEADEVASPQEWRSVIVFGRYEELPDSPEWKAKREFVHELLQQRRIWWEPGYARTVLGGSSRPLHPVYFQIVVEKVTGHLASSDTVEEPPPRMGMAKDGWMKRVLARTRFR